MAIAGVGLVAVVATACGSSSSSSTTTTAAGGASATPLRILEEVPSSLAVLQANATMAANAAKAAVSVVNKAGESSDTPSN